MAGAGTLFHAAVSSVEPVVEGTIRGYFGRRLAGAVSCAATVRRQVARLFAADGVPFETGEQDPETVEKCLAEGCLAPTAPCLPTPSAVAG